MQEQSVSLLQKQQCLRKDLNLKADFNVEIAIFRLLIQFSALFSSKKSIFTLKNKVKQFIFFKLKATISEKRAFTKEAERSAQQR